MLVNSESIEKTVRNIINDLKDSVSVNPETAIRYPGENVVKVREENIRNGIPVNREVWQKIVSF
jgi:3-dehydro-L-gulonate 2-dehydrogenase